MSGDKDAPGADEEQASVEAEPERMSWFAIGFMAICVLMTAALVYYVWIVYERAV
jgi:hypothetical protein